MMKSIRQLITVFRTEYISQCIKVNEIADNPMDQFEKWIDNAVRNKIYLPNAMHLATVGTDGRPSGRINLLRGFDVRGFVFFTNHDSRKGNDLKSSNYASISNWRGFYLSPISIEFWQGRAHRLHDRILYILEKNNSWNIQRLYP